MTTTTPATDRTAYLLPPEAYHSRASHEREQRELFGRTWNLVAYGTDLSGPGDWVTAQIGHDPIILVRDEEGEIRGYLNMCRHRGMALAEGTGCGASSLRCPYHGWEFGLGGALVRVPQRSAQFPGLDPEALGLLPVAVGTWAGLVFAHPDPDAAESLVAWLGEFPTPAFVGDFPWDDLVEVDRVQWDLACNWKFYIENHIDCYHLWYLHEESLGMYDHHALTCRSTGLHWACDEPERPGAHSRREELPHIEGAAEAEDRVVRANLLFPNVPWSSTGKLVTTYQVIPTGPESCRLDLRMRARSGTELPPSVRAGNRRILYEEDGFACEQMQQVVRSPRFAVGPLAAVHERPIMEFHQNLLRFLP